MLFSLRSPALISRGLFPLVCWGIGLTFHYVDVFRREGASIEARQREIEEYAERSKVHV